MTRNHCETITLIPAVTIESYIPHSYMVGVGIWSQRGPLEVREANASASSYTCL